MNFQDYLNEYEDDGSDAGHDAAISHALRASSAVLVARGYTYVPQDNFNAYDGGRYYHGWREYLLPASGEQVFIEAVHMHSHYEFCRLLDRAPRNFVTREVC